MPEMSVKLVILKRLTAHLAGMNTAEDYDCDMADKVFRGRALYGKSDPLPLLSLLEGPDSAEGVPGGENKAVRNTLWRILVQGFVEDDKHNPTDPAYALMAQVVRRLSEVTEEAPNGRPKHASVYRLGGLINELIIGNGVVRPPQEGVSDKAFFWLPVTIGFANDARRPLMTVADVDNP
jgi:hypothetical protein